MTVPTGAVKGETEYRDPSNPDEALPPEHMIKAFRWAAGRHAALPSLAAESWLHAAVENSHVGVRLYTCIMCCRAAQWAPAIQALKVAAWSNLLVLLCNIFRYGQQLVPVPDAATAELMRYSPGKCMDLIGFTSKDNVPRW